MSLNRLNMWALRTVLLMSMAPARQCLWPGTFVKESGISAENAYVAHNFIMALAQSESLLVIQTDLCSGDLLDELLRAPTTAVLLQNLHTTPLPQQQYSSNVLHVICLASESFEQEFLVPLASVWNENRQAKLLFYFTAEAAPTRFTLEALFKLFYELKMLHVVAIAPVSWLDNRHYYTYRAYPKFSVEQYDIETSRVFATNFPNMQGHRLMILPDQHHSRSVVYKDKRTGALVLSGSVGRFMRTLGWKLNATLQYPFPIEPGHFIHSSAMRGFVERGEIDVPGGTQPISTANQLKHATYPLELTKICVMIPTANEIPRQDMYLQLISSPNIVIAIAIVFVYGLLLSLQKRIRGPRGALTRLGSILINDVALRGLIGQSFKLVPKPGFCVKLIYFVLGVMGLNLSCIHEAHLGTILTHPPRHKQLLTFEDLIRQQIPLAIDIDDMHATDKLPLLRSLRLLPLNNSEFIRMRETMNTSNVYLCTSNTWTLYSAKQNYFARDLFIFSNDACYSRLSLVSFYLPNNSWFAAPINKLALEVQENGILQYWFNCHFYDMLKAGLVSFRDLSQPKTHGNSLLVDDLKWVWYAYLGLLLVATLIFALELVCHKCLNSARNGNENVVSKYNRTLTLILKKYRRQLVETRLQSSSELNHSGVGVSGFFGNSNRT